MDGYLVASSASSTPENARKAKSVGLRHAYGPGAEQTLCGLTVRYLYVIENEKWTGRTPQRCGKCEAAVEQGS